MSSAEKQQRKAARKLPGKDQGLTFWQCFAKDRLYTKDMLGIRPYLYIIPFFLAYFVQGTTATRPSRRKTRAKSSASWITSP